jgi:proton glutamate symport protein
MKNKFLIAGLILYLIAAILSVAGHHGFAINPLVGEIIRWAAVFALILFGYSQRSLTTWILVSMVLGAEVGNDFPHFAENLQILSQIFLRMIRVIIAPLLFATLVSGIGGHSDIKKVGRLGWKSLVYFEIVTTLALVIGLAAINISKAGVGVQFTATAEGASPIVAARPSASEMILHIFPENIAKSVAENQVLQVVVFSMIFGIALAMVKEPMRKPMLDFSKSLAEVMFKFTNIVMLYAPIGIAGAIAYTIAHTGFGVLYNLGQLVATLYIAFAICVVAVLWPSAVIARLPVREFIKAVTEPATIAFSTTSSEAALPSAMESMEAYGVPREIVAFVIPTGYSFNLTGATLYLALASVFVAQVAGIHLGLKQQLFMMLVLMLTSKGVAGVSRGSFIILLAAADSLGLPKEPMLLLLGVDQFLDMGRTTMNVVGNCLASAVIAKWEGEFRTEKPSPSVQGVLAEE